MFLSGEDFGKADDGGGRRAGLVHGARKIDEGGPFAQGIVRRLARADEIGGAALRHK